MTDMVFQVLARKGSGWVHLFDADRLCARLAVSAMRRQGIQAKYAYQRPEGVKAKVRRGRRDHRAVR